MKQALFLCFLLPACFVAMTQDSTLNELKLNVTSLAVNNYQLIYERGLTHRIAVGLGVRYMPKGNLPFEKQFKKSVKSDKVNFDEFQLGNFALTPECRIYMGKGYMHGFYISVYGRYASFDVTAPIEYTKNNGTTETVLFDGKVNSYSAGLMFGVQYTLWKVVVLDIMILGGHYGGCSGTINANDISPALSPQDQQSLQNNINTINAKPFHVTGQVTSSTTAVINASGPWGGIRSGINLGVRF
jgi:hypothetical protein